MNPQIQYARTGDGVSIACYALGQGAPVVVMRLPTSHVEREWMNPSDAALWSSIARGARLIRYDHRGFGLSDRQITDFSIEFMAKDLEAALDKLEFHTVSLIAQGVASPVALYFAAHNPQRVSRIVLSPGFDRPDGRAWRRWALLAEHAASDWEFASESMIRATFGWENEQQSKAWAVLLREAIHPDTLKLFWRGSMLWNVRNLIPHINAPTLLVQERDPTYTTIENARALVSALPYGRLLIPNAPSDGLIAAAGFLGGDPRQLLDAPPAGTAVILFADIADSTALTERMGDAAFREKARALDDALRVAVRNHGGDVIDAKTLGDGILATFPAASQAIAAALACGRAGEGAGLPLHLGLHAGDVIRESDNVFGGAVNIAARISALSAPGEVLLSATVRDLGRTSAGVVFEDRGDHALKGIAEPQRVFAVRQSEVG